MGEKLLKGLHDVKTKYPWMIKEVRGKGLLAGIEFAEDDIAALVITGCGRRDLLAAYSLNNPKVVRIEPPLVIEESELDLAVSIIAEAVEETGAMLEGVSCEAGLE